MSLFIAVVFVCSYLGARDIYNLTLCRHVMLIPVFSGLILFTDFMTTKRLGPASERTFIESYLDLVISRFPTAGTSSRQSATLPQDQTIFGVGAAGLDLVQVSGLRYSYAWPRLVPYIGSDRLNHRDKSIQYWGLA